MHALAAAEKGVVCYKALQVQSCRSCMGIQLSGPALQFEAAHFLQTCVLVTLSF